MQWPRPMRRPMPMLLPAICVHASGAPCAPPPSRHVRSQVFGVTQAAPVGCMNTNLRQQLLQQIIATIRRARPLVAVVERKDRDLASQLRRSLNSIALNVAEAFGGQAGNARLSFRRALGELYESQAALQLSAAWGYVSESQAIAIDEELAAVGARLYGLSRH